MAVRPLDRSDCEAYAQFRRQLWPGHVASGNWEVVLAKYFSNPQMQNVPGAGLIGLWNKDRLIGTLGAYPMPVMLGGLIHNGLSMIDWTILPEFRLSPASGQLFNHFMKLGGMKFGSIGTRDSQAPLAKRAKKINAVSITAELDVVAAMVLRRYGLARSQQAAPLTPEDINASGARLFDPEQHADFSPPRPDVACFYRPAGFWTALCRARIHTGCIPIELGSPDTAVRVILKATQAGQFRFATLLALAGPRDDNKVVSQAGAALRGILKKWNVVSLGAIEGDEQTKVLVNSITSRVRRAPTHWWSIPTPADPFDSQAVRWRLTAADRDGIWSGLELFSGS